MNKISVSAVLVTYGDRISYLEKVITKLEFIPEIENKILIIFPMILFLLVLFIKSIDTGYFRYQTIFSDEFRVQKLKERIYN